MAMPFFARKFEEQVAINPGECAAQLRVSEKNFVAESATKFFSETGQVSCTAGFDPMSSGQQDKMPSEDIFAMEVTGSWRLGLSWLCQSWIPLRIKQKRPMEKERASRIRLAEMEEGGICCRSSPCRRSKAPCDVWMQVVPASFCWSQRSRLNAPNLQLALPKPGRYQRAPQPRSAPVATWLHQNGRWRDEGDNALAVDANFCGSCGTQRKELRKKEDARSPGAAAPSAPSAPSAAALPAEAAGKGKEDAGSHMESTMKSAGKEEDAEMSQFLSSLQYSDSSGRTPSTVTDGRGESKESKWCGNRGVSTG
ncbi:unnamed protein product [Cladocopium goreaui]|uniref:Uncharacterized protein n=1 Tax=Cladocopium goreaui TaxID=2562237 RepID=A0A9P1FSK6_9DINO|nr:unnamed protein product [Cladocopium goreaui]